MAPADGWKRWDSSSMRHTSQSGRVTNAAAKEIVGAIGEATPPCGGGGTYRGHKHCGQRFTCNKITHVTLSTPRDEPPEIQYSDWSCPCFHAASHKRHRAASPRPPTCFSPSGEAYMRHTSANMGGSSSLAIMCTAVNSSSDTSTAVDGGDGMCVSR